MPLDRRSTGTPSFVGFHPSSEAASRCKRANRKYDTRPELLLRQALWACGLRYRKHVSGIVGNPDVVFRPARVVVFCDGDFWHGRNWPKLRAQLQRRHNASYWVAKIARNRQRDRQRSAHLVDEGWTVVRLWESDILRDARAAAEIVRQVVASSRAGRTIGSG